MRLRIEPPIGSRFRVTTFAYPRALLAFVRLRMPFPTATSDDGSMSNHFHAVVWIDHQQAKVVHFNADSSEPVVVHSTHPHQHLHHKANSSDSGHAPTDKKFLERVAAALNQAGAILVVGPASAKTELHTYLKSSQPHIAAKISAVETMDHPTDGQLLAHARHFFRADDRMRAQIRA
jgi:hypothetical protein